MKTASQIVGVVGILVILMAIYGRFHGAPTVALHGHLFAGASVLLMGTAILVIGLFLAVLGLQEKK